MTETIFTPQSMRTVNIANTTIIGFARNIDDEDSLILRNIGQGEQSSFPFLSMASSRYPLNPLTLQPGSTVLTCSRLP